MARNFGAKVGTGQRLWAIDTEFNPKFPFGLQKRR
jgi:hypothetical protein